MFCREDDKEDFDNYDYVHLTWRRMSPSDARLNFPRCQHGTAEFKGRLWIAGGITRGEHVVKEGGPSLHYFETEGSTSVEYYDPLQDKWVFGPSLGAKRRGCDLLVVDGQLVCVGGDSSFGGLSGHLSMERLDEAKGEWVLMAYRGDQRRNEGSACSATLPGGAMAVFGGYGTESCRTIAVYESRHDRDEYERGINDRGWREEEVTLPVLCCAFQKCCQIIPGDFYLKAEDARARPDAPLIG